MGKNDQLAVQHWIKIVLLVDRSSEILIGLMWKSMLCSNETPANGLHDPPFLCNSSDHVTVWQSTYTDRNLTTEWGIHKVFQKEREHTFLLLK